jgi:hypothetical protein
MATAVKALALAVVLLGALVMLARMHGRAIRAERTALGFGTIDAADIPAPVRALWKRDRNTFIALSLVIAGLTIAAGVALAVPVATIVVTVVLGAPALSLGACGVLSRMRVARSR